MKHLIFSWQNRILPRPAKNKLTAFAVRAAELAKLPDGDWDLEILFTNDRDMAVFNADIVGHTGTTDVITLSYFDGEFPVMPGETGIELIINPDAAAREGAKRKNSSYPVEMARYLVHGLLHSAGFDDLDPVFRRTMRRKELQLLRKLAAENLTPESVFPAE